jgi:predicted Zn finger-like uncharacterized protein
MAQTIACPSCGAAYSVHDDLVGKQIRCKGCQHLFRATAKRSGTRSSDVEIDDTPARRRNPDVVVDDVEIDEPAQRRRKPAKKPRENSSLAVPITIGVVSFVVVLAVVGGIIYAIRSSPGPQVAQNGPGNPPPPGPAPQPPGPQPPAPSPPAPQTRADAKLQGAWTKVFLTDMDEFDVVKGPWPLGKHGTTGAPGAEDTSIRLKGIASPNGLGMHPPSNGHARARYSLGRQAQEVRGAVGFNDWLNATGQPAPSTFVILGDGKELWRSPLMNAREVKQDFRVNVSQVDVLEIRVECAVFGIHAHAVWFEPHVVKDAKTPVE